MTVERLRQNDTLNHRLAQVEVWDCFERFFHDLRIQALIRLSARRLYCRTLTFVEQTDLNERAVGHAPHQSAQCVDLAHQMPLCRTADRRIARHMCQFIEINRQQQGSTSHARGGVRCLASGVPCADNDDIVDVWMNAVHIGERQMRQYQSMNNMIMIVIQTLVLPVYSSFHGNASAVVRIDHFNYTVF